MAGTNQGAGGRYASNYVMRELGVLQDVGGTKFRTWLPFANDVKLVLFGQNQNEVVHQMKKEPNDCWSVVVPDVQAGQEYVYRIDGIDKSDPRAQEMVHSAGNSIVYKDDYQWQVDDFNLPAWNELVIYQMHCATYPDKTPMKQDLIKSIKDELFYLEKLGVNAIALLPVSEFPGNVSLGYNTAALYAIESTYGGPDALKELVDAAHARGIAVFLDVVYNHMHPDYGDPGTGDKSIWKITKWHGHLSDGSDGGGAYFYNDDRMPTPYGPRPDYGRQEVREFLRDNVMTWLLEYRIDGLRFDSVANIRNAHGNDSPLNQAYDIKEGWWLLQDINNSVRGEWGKRNLLTIAEDLKDSEWITKDPGAGGAGFNTQWDSGFMDPVREVLTRTWDQDRDMFKMRDILYRRYNGDAFQHIVTMQTHDAAAELNHNIRLADAIDRGHVDTSWFVKKKIGLGAAMVMCAAGIPMILQGDELLEWRQFGDDPSKHAVDWNRFCDTTADCRACMTSHGKCLSPGGAPCSKNILCSECPEIAERCTPEGPFSGIFTMFRDLIHLRRNWHDNTRGLRGQHINVFHVNNTDKLIAFHRWEHGGPGDDVIVVVNFANRAYDSYTIGLPRDGHYQVRFNSDSNRYDKSFGNFFSYGTDAIQSPMDGLSFKGNIGIGPYSAIILSQ